MTIGVSNNQDRIVPTALIEELAASVLTAESLPEGTEVAFALVDEIEMAGLNEAHMGKEGPTDVLAFPLEDLVPGAPPSPGAGGPPVALGDVFICPAVVGANAAAAGVPFEDEMALMVVHGLLHLLGYDHVDDADAELMEGREAELLERVGRRRP